MEKLVHEYLNSMVGSDPTLKVSKETTNFIRSINSYMYRSVYSVNGIEIGSRKDGVKKISMNRELYDSTRKLFGLNNLLTSQYFNNWLNNIPIDK
jgi:hypothetical protein